VIEWLTKRVSGFATAIWDQVVLILVGLLVAAVASWAVWDWLGRDSQIKNWVTVLLSAGWVSTATIAAILIVRRLRSPRDLEVVDSEAGLRWTIKPEIREHVTKSFHSLSLDSSEFSCRGGQAARS